MNFAEHADDFAENGFTVVRDFLSGEEVERLRDEIARFMRDILPSLPKDQAFYHERADGSRAIRQIHRMNCDPFFEDLRHHPRWVALAEALIGEEAHANTPQWLNKPPNTVHHTPPHQDNRYFHLSPPKAAMIFVALERIDEENGCLRYLPGSHKKGLRPHAMSGVLGFSQGITDFSDEERDAATLITLGPGDACCHHPVSVHWADPNRSATRSREAYAVLFEGVSAKVDQEAFARYQQEAQSWDELR